MRRLIYMHFTRTFQGGEYAQMDTDNASITSHTDPTRRTGTDQNFMSPPLDIASAGRLRIHRSRGQGSYSLMKRLVELVLGI